MFYFYTKLDIYFIQLINLLFFYLYILFYNIYQPNPLRYLRLFQSFGRILPTSHLFGKERLIRFDKPNPVWVWVEAS